MKNEPIVLDSVTSLDDQACNAVVIVGSHGGTYAAYRAAAAGVRAVILNDASIGLDMAGIAGLDYLQKLKIPAAAVSANSARIGDGLDCLARGIISHANSLAQDYGCRAGQTCAVAVGHLSQCVPLVAVMPKLREARHLISVSPVKVWALDSAALVEATDIGSIVLTGSHGALLGGCLETAIRAKVSCAVFNDAGIGMDEAGTSRLPVLDGLGIPAMTVSTWSARIGDGLSTYNDGIFSVVNNTAFKKGARVGMSAKSFVKILSSENLGRI